MNYIVFDLEWNQSPIGQAGEHPRMPFEIIEIGAVKLDEELNIVDEFNRLIKPKLYPKFHKYVKNMLSYDENVLKQRGVNFKLACTEFLEWCDQGEYVFCTWGASDLYYLQNNMDFYRMEKLPFPLKFYDIQQIYADKYSADKSICKLEKAVHHLDLDMDRPFHAAINDAYYTAKVFKAADLGDISDKYTFDIYRHPKHREEAIMAFHDGVIDQISEEYSSRREALDDKDIITVKCAICGRKISKKLKWFQINNSTQCCVGKCFLHGNMMATMKLKSASDSSDEVFVVKRVVPISKKKFNELKEKRDQIQKKHKEREKRRQERE